MSDLLRDRYEVLEVAGHGGEGQVVKALDHQLDRVVALKIRSIGADTDRDALLREARILLGMSPHPNLPLVREDFFDGDQYVIAMDWVEGVDLARVLQAQGRPGLAPTLVMNWLADAAAALAHLHHQDPPVVHGDVKPANLILGREGRVTLVDFGVSSTPGLSPRRSGTRGYLAPEASSGGAVDRAGDVYSLAATAFALLSGAPPRGVLPDWAGIDPILAAELEAALRVGIGDGPGQAARDTGRARRAPARGVDVDAPVRSAHLLRHRHRRRGGVVGRVARRDGTRGCRLRRPRRGHRGAARRPVRHVDGRRDGVGVLCARRRRRGRAQPRDPARRRARRERGPTPCPHRSEHRRGNRAGRRLLGSGPARRDAGARPCRGRRGARVTGDRRRRRRAPARRHRARRRRRSGVRAHLRRAPRPPPGTICPYPGLVAFGAADASLFVGREAVVDDVLARLDTDQFVALVGASGSGKSSLLRAGVAPRVPGAVVITPGAHPLDTYANCSRDGLLIVDQFEETYTVCDDPDERITFINLLLQRSGPVALGIRADFYGRCATHPRLAVAVAEHHLLLGPMTDEELRRAIVEPAEQVGLRLDPGLVDVMVAEVSGEVGGLPLLAHTLRVTWEARDGRALTLDVYRRTGGVHGAIARTADRVYESLDPVDQELARQLFLRLVEPGEGTEDTRRRANLNELTPQTEYPRQLRAVLDAQTEARLITVDAGTIELAHEALIREWPRLQSWLDEDRADITIRAHVTAAAKAWEARGHDPAELYRGPRLTDALEWMERSPQVSGEEHEFIAASRAERDAGERAQKRANRRLRGLLIGTAVALVIALVGGGIAFAQRRTATDARERADVARIAALSRALSERSPDVGTLLAAEAYTRRATDDTESTLLASLQSHPLLEGLLYGVESRLEALAFSPDGRILATPTSDGSGTFLWDTRTRRRVAKLAYEKDTLLDAAVSPDGRWLAVVGGYQPDDQSYPGRLQIWDLTTRKLHKAVTTGSIVALNTVAFSADGRRLYTEGGHDLQEHSPLRVLIWDTETWKPIGQPWTVADEFYEDGLTTMSADGSVLAAPLSNSAVQVWNTDDRTPMGDPIELPGEDLHALALDADGGTLVIADSGSLRVVNTKTGAIRDTGDTGLALVGPTIAAIDLSADGAMLAAGDVEGRTQLFDMAGGEALGVPLTANGSEITNVSFSADGRHLAIRGLDRTAALWRLDGDRSVGAVRVRQQGPATETHFTPDGRTLVTGSTDGSVAIADARSGKVLRTVRVDGEVRTVAIDRSGKRFAVGGTEGRVRVFDLATGKPYRDHAVGKATVNQLAFDPTSDALAITISPENPDEAHPYNVILWNPARGDAVAQIDLGPQEPMSVAWSPDGKQIATSADCCMVQTFRADGDHREIGKPIDNVDTTIFAVAFSPDGQRLATGASSGVVRQWSVSDHKPVGAPLEGTTGVIGGLAYSPDGTMLAATTLGLGTTRLWNAQSGAAIGDHFTAGRTPFSDRTFLINYFIGARPSFSPDGQRLATVGFDGLTTVWDLSPAHWLDAACTLVGRNFTRDEWRQHVGASGYHETCT